MAKLFNLRRLLQYIFLKTSIFGFGFGSLGSRYGFKIPDPMHNDPDPNLFFSCMKKRFHKRFF